MQENVLELEKMDEDEKGDPFADDKGHWSPHKQRRREIGDPGLKKGPIIPQVSGNRRYSRVLYQSQPSLDSNPDAHDGPSREIGAEASWACPSAGREQAEENLQCLHLRKTHPYPIQT